MALRRKRSWVYKKLIEFTSELANLNTLMIGCYISLYEIVNPSLESEQSEVISTKINTLDVLLKKYEYDSKTRKDMTRFLRGQFRKDFPLMYGLWTMMLWSILENFVKDFLVEWIKRNPETIKKLPIKLSEYETFQEDDKYEIIVEAVEYQLRHRLGIGTNRFETLLEQFGLSGKVHKDLQEKILELQQVRHVLVHRNGIADKKLMQRCPWIKIRPDGFVFIDSKIYDTYFAAVADYAAQIAIRANNVLNQ